MKKNEIQVGGCYIAKVSNKLTTVRVNAIREYDPSFGGLRRANTQTHYDVTNLTTGRHITFRSAAKFRRMVASAAIVASIAGSIASLSAPESRHGGVEVTW